MPLAEKQKFFEPGEAREWSSKWSYSQGWFGGNFRRENLQTSSIPPPPPKLHTYIGVIRVSSGGQPVTRLFDATPFSRVQFSTRVYIINDNDIYPPPWKFFLIDRLLTNNSFLPFFPISRTHHDEIVSISFRVLIIKRSYRWRTNDTWWNWHDIIEKYGKDGERNAVP